MAILRPVASSRPRGMLARQQLANKKKGGGGVERDHRAGGTKGGEDEPR